MYEVSSPVVALACDALWCDSECEEHLGVDIVLNVFSSGPFHHQ